MKRYVTAVNLMPSDIVTFSNPIISFGNLLDPQLPQAWDPKCAVVAEASFLNGWS